MQIVIDIPDTEIPIERAMDTITLFFENGHVCKCNYPFKELPKGHGDLIDRKLALSDDGLCEFHMYEDYVKMRNYLKSIPTIIEKEQEK